MYLLICSLAVSSLAAEPQESNIRLSLNQKIALGVGTATAVILGTLAWYACTHKKGAPVVVALSPRNLQADPQETPGEEVAGDEQEDQIEPGSDVVKASRKRVAESTAMKRKFTDPDDVVVRAQKLIKNTNLVNKSDQESLCGDVGHSRSPSLEGIEESDLGHVSDREVLHTISEEPVQKSMGGKALTI